MIDVFASFFLISHGMLMYQAATVIQCQTLHYTKNGTPHHKHVSMFLPYVDCRDSNPIAKCFIVILFIDSVPILLLVLYPFKLFRQCLSKCKLDRLCVTTFVEKFHGCYRDGLDGGRDMRSFSGMYYVLIILLSQYNTMRKILRLKISRWLYYAFIFLSFALLIMIIRPYKQKYVNILETLFLIYIAISCILLSRDPFAGEETQFFIILLIPSVALGLLLFLKACIRLKNSLMKDCKQYSIGNKVDSNKNSDETQTLINPSRNYITYGK